MTPEDLSLLRSVADPRLSPDGTRVVYVVGRMDVEEDERSSRLHLLDLTTGEDRVLTAGRRDSSPRWSPDGSRIAFVRAGEGAPGQLAVIDPDGGEAAVLTAVPEGVDAAEWAPDGGTVVVGSRRWRDGDHERGADERAERPRRITELGYRYDNRGWLHDKVRRLFAVDVDAATATDPVGAVRAGDTPDGDAPDGDAVETSFVALTPDDVDVDAFTVTTDGRLVFTSPRQDTRETDAATGVWATSLDGAGADPDRLEQLLPPRSVFGLRAGLDGDLLLLGHDEPEEWPAPPRLFRHADGELVELAADLDRDVVGAVPVADGGVLALVEDAGAVHVRRVGADGEEVTTVVGGARMVTGIDASADGTVIVLASTHPEDPGELWVVRDDGEPEVLTAHNAELRDRLLPVEHLRFERDGAEVDAWVLLPDGEDGDVPLLLNIHGGPTAQYGFGFFDEFQVYAAAGYAVIGCNPRGSSGRGTDWSTAVVGAWQDEASVDVLDLEAAVDAALAHSDRISRDRIGIMGGSYGGYATARILARSDRFRSAVVERGLLNWVSFSGTSDIGPFFDRMFLGRELDEDLSVHWAASPVRTAARITTPTLVLHSLEDYRCPVEQALQLFQGLRRAGVESELVLFPGEGHELSRSGSPKHRVERFEAILDWHDRQLGVDRGDGTDDGQGGADA